MAAPTSAAAAAAAVCFVVAPRLPASAPCGACLVVFFLLCNCSWCLHDDALLLMLVWWFSVALLVLTWWCLPGGALLQVYCCSWFLLRGAMLWILMLACLVFCCATLRHFENLGVSKLIKRFFMFLLCVGKCCQNRTALNRTESHQFLQRFDLGVVGAALAM